MTSDPKPKLKLPPNFRVVQPKAGTVVAVIGVRREQDAQRPQRPDKPTQ
jgi:hypothetical protein